MKKKNNHDVEGSMAKAIRKITEIDKIDTPNTHTLGPGWFSELGSWIT